MSALVAVLVCGGAGAACSLPGSGAGTVVIYVNAPFASSRWVGRMGQQGAQLAADQINNRTGVLVRGKSYRIKIRTADHKGSPDQALANVRKAAGEKAVAVIDDGSTVTATADAARQAGLPLLVYFDGTTGIVDPAVRPNVFRLAPSNQALARRLGTYLAGKGPRLALVHDDSAYGADGASQLRQALAAAGTALVADVTATAGLPDYRDQAARAAAAQPNAVVVWAQAPVVAGVLQALRELGSTLPVYTAPTGEDPSVRTALASRPDWVQGLTFASLRITDAAGLARWVQFRLAYETRYGEDKLGLGESIRRPVVQPPDWQMLSYDMVYLVKAALEKAGTTDPSNGKLVSALNEVQAQGANGATVGWTASNHEGIGEDQVYFAVILNLNFQPVQDDPISKAQPQIEQD
ncbi:MAG: branched-chain amino acid transport system substrate-binding protein [Actinomycetota bacterium]|nr:branched-chain amino acid transport system substrate-binding protein [Actinomycetota bacterium]